MTYDGIVSDGSLLFDAHFLKWRQFRGEPRTIARTLYCFSSRMSAFRSMACTVH